jgi:hypothetical protein
MTAGVSARRPVVLNADGWLVGIVTPHDLLKVYVRKDEEIATKVRQDIVAHYLGTNPSLVRIAVNDAMVALGGVVETKSVIPLAVSMPRAVDVVGHLGYTIDDTHLPRTADMTGY